MRHTEPSRAIQRGALVGRLRERLQLRWIAEDKDGGLHQLVDAEDLRDALRLIVSEEDEA